MRCGTWIGLNCGVELDGVSWDVYADVLDGYLAVIFLATSYDTVVVGHTKRLGVELEVAILAILNQRLLEACDGGDSTAAIGPPFECIVDIELGDESVAVALVDEIVVEELEQDISNQLMVYTLLEVD